MQVRADWHGHGAGSCPWEEDIVMVDQDNTTSMDGLVGHDTNLKRGLGGEFEVAADRDGRHDVDHHQQHELLLRRWPWTSSYHDVRTTIHHGGHSGHSGLQLNDSGTTRTTTDRGSSAAGSGNIAAPVPDPADPVPGSGSGSGFGSAVSSSSPGAFITFAAFPAPVGLCSSSSPGSSSSSSSVDFPLPLQLQSPHHHHHHHHHNHHHQSPTAIASRCPVPSPLSPPVSLSPSPPSPPGSDSSLISVDRESTPARFAPESQLRSFEQISRQHWPAAASRVLHPSYFQTARESALEGSVVLLSGFDFQAPSASNSSSPPPPPPTPIPTPPRATARARARARASSSDSAPRSPQQGQQETSEKRQHHQLHQLQAQEKEGQNSDEQSGKVQQKGLEQQSQSQLRDHHHLLHPQHPHLAPDPAVLHDQDQEQNAAGPGSRSKLIRLPGSVHVPPPPRSPSSIDIPSAAFCERPQADPPVHPKPNPRPANPAARRYSATGLLVHRSGGEALELPISRPPPLPLPLAHPILCDTPSSSPSPSSPSSSSAVAPVPRSSTPSPNRPSNSPPGLTTSRQVLRKPRPSLINILASPSASPRPGSDWRRLLSKPRSLCSSDYTTMTGTVKRSLSTPNVQQAAASMADSASGLPYSTDKRRNKLGYHRTSVACGHCRRRKIRCLLAKDDHHGRCSNCIRLKKECNFYPVESSDRRPRSLSKTDMPNDHSSGSSPSPGLGLHQMSHDGHYPTSLPVTPTYDFGGPGMDDSFRHQRLAGRLSVSHSASVSRRPSLAQMHAMPLAMKAEQGFLGPADGFSRQGWELPPHTTTGELTSRLPEHPHPLRTVGSVEDASAAFWRLNSSPLASAPYVSSQASVGSLPPITQGDSPDSQDEHGWHSAAPSRIGSIDHGVGTVYGYSYPYSPDTDMGGPPELRSASASTASLTASISEASQYGGGEPHHHSLFASHWMDPSGHAFDMEAPMKQENTFQPDQYFNDERRYSSVDENTFVFPSPIPSPAPV